MTHRPIRLKQTALAWLMAGAALPAFAQIPFTPNGASSPAPAAAAAGGSIDVGATKPAVEAAVNAEYPHLDALYKDLHAHPELAFQETRTAAKLAAEMRKIGFEVTEHVAKTGVVAVYRNGPGPTILVRTELDALPMEEKTRLPYASHARTQWKGEDVAVAHSCGHDVHMTAWVGTAKTLVSLKDRWHGTLMFIAQPAEEAVAGAQSMLDDGLFKRFPKPDYAFALHTGPGPYGSIVFNSGPITSNSDGLEITFKGRGGHGSAPDKTIDPVMMAARFVVDLQSVISREKDPQEFGVVSIGAIQGGSAENIIPDSVTLRGTIRSYKPAVRQKMLDGIRRTAKAVTEMSGAPDADIKLTEGGKAVNNDPAVVARTEAMLKTAFGGERVMRVPPITASEDFSAFVDTGIPSMFFFIGVNEPQQFFAALKPGAKPLPTNHSPLFAPVPEPSIKTGVEAMSMVVMNALQWNKSAGQ
ncbi:M20 family metallopeptidase [uncultured Ralstonia sp.]|jgi:amidohydrolase|uniref:M20 family metallopeptidase n=1 Tax=Ralstonia sp. TaxID=54061 RepID=UPI0025E98001|nr:M20 family metallopeptidase [uncultured Ralstonia sp.]